MKIKFKKLTSEQKKDLLAFTKKIAIIAAIALFVALFVEFLFNFKRIRLGSDGRKAVDITAGDVELIGIEQQGDKFVTTGDQNRMIINKSSAYTYKFSYDCSPGRDFYAMIFVYQTPVGAKNPVYKEFKDRNNLCIYHSEEVIKGTFDHIEVSFLHYDVDAQKEDYIKGLEISNIKYDNSLNINARRMWLVFFFVLILLIMITYRELVAKRIEVGFAIAALGIGLVMVFGFPAYKVTWDEEVHFKGSYKMALAPKVVVTPEVDYYFDANRVASLYYPMAECEFGQFKEFLNASKIYSKSNPDNYLMKSGPEGLYDVGHIAGSIGINIGRILHLPLWWVYILGKLTNLLMYVGITYLAIRHIRIGKGIMTVLALMPTILFQASVYSYDATANAFAFLAMSYLITAIVDKENVFDWKQCAVFVGGIAIASCVRIVYAPLILLVLFVPKAHFSSKRAWAIIKGGLLGVCAIGALGLLYLATHSAGIEGDLRGGAVSVSGQIEYIMHNPVVYGKMLLFHMWDWLGAYTIGNDALGQFAHLRGFPFNFVMYVIMLFFIFTDTSDVDIKPLTRVGIAAILFGTAIGIWTSMYIFFTPVGFSGINGVQARYFVPLLIPLYLLFNTKYIQNNIPKRVYHVLCIMLPLFITSGMMFILMTVLSK